jgi:FkbM family methyltransferase
MQSLMRISRSLYRRSPLYPHLNRSLLKMIGMVRPSRELRMRHVRDFQMFLDPCQHIDTKIDLAGEFEPETVDAISRVLRPGMVAMDVGANIGYLSLVMASLVGSEGRVIAFEPSDWTFERLSRNVAINPSLRIDAHRLAVGDHSQDDVELRLPRGYRLDGSDTSALQTVGVTTIDEFVEKHSLIQLDFLKSDTDGFEPAVMRGASETLRRFKPLVLFEVAPEALESQNSSPDDLFGPLIEIGYTFFADSNLGIEVEPKAVIAQIATGVSVNLLARVG